MLRYISMRIVTGIFSLLVVTLLIFGVSRLYGDPMSLYVPAEGYGLSPEEQQKIKEMLHLDDPFIVQYGFWLKNLMTGDLHTVGSLVCGETRLDLRLYGKDFCGTRS
jgi:peptide/nickel transport system permease protein